MTTPTILMTLFVIWWTIGIMAMIVIDDEKGRLIKYVQQCPIGGYIGYFIFIHWWMWPIVVHLYLKGQLAGRMKIQEDPRAKIADAVSTMIADGDVQDTLAILQGCILTTVKCTDLNSTPFKTEEEFIQVIAEKMQRAWQAKKEIDAQTKH